MAILKWDAFEGGHSGSQVREGLVDSGSSKLDMCVRPMSGWRGRGRSCLNDSQG